MTRMLKSLRGGGISLIRHCEILQRRIVAIHLFLAIFAILTNLHSKELSEICKNGNCTISAPESDITNTSPFSTNDNNKIELKNAHITNFTNTSTIKTYEFSINGSYDNKSYIENFYNYGRIETNNTASLNTTTTGENGGYRNIHNYGYISGFVYLSQNESGTTHITNYGEMGGVVQNVNASKAFTVDNRGTINLFQQDNSGKKIHFRNIKSLTLKNYAMKITSNASAFNSFDGNAKNNSHLVLDNVSSVSFADKNAKLILDFGDSFEFGAGYLFSKLVIDTNGNNALGVDLSRLTPRSDIYTLYKQGEYFIAKLTPQHSAISNISKSNIRTMNNFYTISNSMIYPRKSQSSQNLTRKNQNNLVILRERSDRRISNVRDSSPKAQNDNIMLDSANSLKSYESFAYRNESINRRIQRQNKRNYSRTKRNNNSVILSDSEESQKKNNRDSSPKAQNDNVRKSQNLKENQRFSQNLNTDSANQNNSSLRADSQNLRGNPKNKSNPQTKSTSQTQTFSQNLAQNPNNYYFILTPFFNYNSFAQSGNYNLNGFDYGFLTAFSTQVAESNSLGAHFIFSYGSLGDKQDKDLSIKSLNLNVGLNYKLDLIYDMYLKARGDFFYFLNQVKTLTMFEAIKPNNLGFGVSVIFGKDFDFGNGGVLGVEAGIDYKALKTNAVSLNSQTYKQSLLNLIYVDLGMNYNKYFGSFGINLGGGFKANLAPKLAESSLMLNSQNLTFTLDNDKYLAYANAGISYVLNHKNFDMEFSLAYYGNFGDRVISNGGGVEWRVVW